MRILPSLRHDLTGPLSVVRMGTATLKRYLDAPACADFAAGANRLGQIEDQLKAMVTSIRALRQWDVASPELMEPAAAMHACVELMRPVLELQGVRIEALAPQQSLAAQPARQAVLLYGVLGAICYLQDRKAKRPRIQLEMEAAGSLRIQLVDAVEELPVYAEPIARTMQIDAQALQWLADDMGLDLRIEGECVHLSPAVPHA